MTYDLIRQWAADRNLIEGSNPTAQLKKLYEEFTELEVAVDKWDHPEMIDAIGDMIVVLTIIAAQIGTNVEHCVAEAYGCIKDRKGKMIDGIFVKEVDLNV